MIRPAHNAGMASHEWIIKALATNKSYDDLPSKVQATLPLSEWKSRCADAHVPLCVCLRWQRQHSLIDTRLCGVILMQLLTSPPWLPLVPNNRARCIALRVKDYCIHRGLDWSTCNVRTCCSEHEYYEDLLRYYRRNTRVCQSSRHVPMLCTHTAPNHSSSPTTWPTTYAA